MTGEVTPQEEIDALGGSDPTLLTPDTAPERVPAHDAVPVETPTPTLLVSATSSPNSNFAQRLSSLEATVAALQESVADGENDAAILALSQQVEALAAQVTELGAQLQNSLGFGLHASFQCGSCGTQGAVGSRVSCMQCGAESWIGWSEQSA